MADHDRKAGGRHSDAGDGDTHQAVDSDQRRGQTAALDAPRGADNGAVRPESSPESNGRAAAAASLTAATEALTKTQWAILGELRKSRQYRKRNPAPLKIDSESLGHCGDCGAWFPMFDQYVHHVFAVHPEQFLADGELMLEAPACECRACAGPGPYLAWLQTPEARGVG